MLEIPRLKTLKSRLILSFLAITVIPSIAISFFYYRSSQSALEKNMIDATQTNLAYSMDFIDKQLNSAGVLSDWFFLNRFLDRILLRNYSGPKISYNPDVQTFMDQLDYQLVYNSMGSSYVSSILVIGKNGADLRGGNDAALVDKTAIQTTSWFKRGIAANGKKVWFGIVKNPAAISLDQYILPLVRPVFHTSRNQAIGWQMIGFRTSLISDLLRNNPVQNDEVLLVMDSRGHCVYHNDTRLIGRDLRAIGYLRKVLCGGIRGHFITRIHKAPRMIIFQKSAMTGWGIVKILSPAELNRQKTILFNITLIILSASFILTSLISIYLSCNLTHPLTKITRQTKAIAAGNFFCDPTTEGQDELGTLGRGINEMARNIRTLLDQVVRDEREKRLLELAVLQNQVNPHFLYNTLNSIKLMAAFQKADGIREIVSALGRLVMTISKDSSEKIPLRDEIALLNDYVQIQNIRYKGKIKLEYDILNDALLKCRIIKFSLQPIVENAIFHGIEPKKDAGRIRIRIREAGDNLLIDVEDDGVGMTEEQIRAVLTGSQAKSRGLSGIGIDNVDQRIKLTYGSGFGLSIESRVGEYTMVRLKIPQEYENATDIGNIEY